MFTSNNVYNEVLSNLFNGFGDLFKAVSPNEKETKGARIYTDIQEFCDRYELWNCQVSLRMKSKLN